VSQKANSLAKRPYARIELALRTATAAGNAERAAVFRAELDRRAAQSRKPIPLTPIAPIPECLDGPEVWLPVPIAEFANTYEVSSFGRVRRVGGKPLAIKPRANQRYLTVSLFRPKAEGGPVTWRLHRLVAGAFVPNPLGLPEVNHKDCDRLNNHAENLEWMTRPENIAHSIEAGRNTAVTNPNKIRKLDAEAVSIIREECAAGVQYTVLAARFGVSQGTIGKIARGLTKIYDGGPIIGRRQPIGRKQRYATSRPRKMNPEKVLALRAKYAAGATPKELAAEFNISLFTAYKIASGRGWKSVQPTGLKSAEGIKARGTQNTNGESKNG